MPAEAADRAIATLASLNMALATVVKKPTLKIVKIEPARGRLTLELRQAPDLKLDLTVSQWPILQLASRQGRAEAVYDPADNRWQAQVAAVMPADPALWQTKTRPVSLKSALKVMLRR